MKSLKTYLLLFTFALMALPVNTNAQQIPKQLYNLVESLDYTYGYTLQSPITFRTGNVKKKLKTARTFFSCLTTDSGSKLSIIQEEKIDTLLVYNLKYTVYGAEGTFIEPKQINFLYKFVLSDGQSNIILFVEPTIKINPKIPVGLKFLY